MFGYLAFKSETANEGLLMADLIGVDDDMSQPAGCQGV
jgi:hypothetical protein